MANGRGTWQIKRVRNEILVALKMIYPAAFQAESLLRTLMCLFPTLEWEDLKRDLAYLTEKEYIRRAVSDTEADERLTPWKHRWFRLTPSGVELADRCILDPALEQ